MKFGAVEDVRDVIDRLVRDGAVIARSDGSRHELFPIAIPSDEGEAILDWVRREKAMQTIEIGLGYGMSALHICEGLLVNGHPEARHVAIDPFQTTSFASC